MASTRLRVIHRLLREQYKIELRIRNHSTLTRRSLIEAVADSVPKQLKVDLGAPEVFVLVEVFKVRHQLIRAFAADLSNRSDWLPLFQNYWETEHLRCERCARLLQAQEIQRGRGRKRGHKGRHGGGFGAIVVKP